MSEEFEIGEVQKSMGNVLSIIEKATLDTQITTAKSYPRNISGCLKESIALAILSKEIAESCIYALPQKNNFGKDIFILGPSIRLAEIALTCWGNLRVGSRPVQNDGKTVIAEGVAWDLEKNVGITIQVSKSIVGKNGTYSAHQQNVVISAAAAIARRNAILTVIPKAFINQIYKEAEKVSKGVDKPLGQRVNEAIKYFNMLGITEGGFPDLVNKKSRDEVDEEDMLLFIGIKNAVVDGIITIDSILKTDQGESKNKADALIKSLKGDQK